MDADQKSAVMEEEVDLDPDVKSPGNIQDDPNVVPGHTDATSHQSWDPRWVTVEPVIFLFMFSWGIHSPAISGLTYRKVCLAEVNDSYICDNLHNKTYHDLEDVVQSHTSHWFLWQNLCYELPAIVLSFVYGSLSDHYSRKLALALPSLGQALSMCNYVINSMYMEWNVAYLLVGQVISGLFGSWITCLLAAFSYLSEISATSKRTVRISVAEGILSLSIAISFVLSGVILEGTSYPITFELCVGIYFCNVIYVFVVLRERPKARHEKPSSFVEAVGLQRIKEAFSCVFKSRPDKKRMKVLMILATLFTANFSYSAMYTVSYLFLKRRPLNWSQTTYGVFVGFYKLITASALFTIVPLMKNRFHMHDTAIIIWAVISTSVGELLFGLSTRSWMVFVLPLAGILSDARTTCMRSFLSTLVDPMELGKMFAAVGSIQSMAGIIGTLVYNTIYPLTLSFWPGFCFATGFFLSFIPLSMMGYLYKESRKSIPYGQLSNEQTPIADENDFDEKKPLIEDTDDDETFSYPKMVIPGGRLTSL